MIPPEFTTRLTRFDQYALDDLGTSLVWMSAVEAIIDGGEVDLSRLAGLDEGARQALADWVLHERAQGHPRIDAHLSVSTWAALEALVEDIFVLRLQLHPQLLEGDLLGRQRVRLAEFLALDEDSRYRLLARSIESSQRAQSPESFEVLLDCVELSGPVAPRVARSLRELEQVRNVLVHRNGVVDERLLRAAYVLQVHTGEPLSLIGMHYLRYYRACTAYADTLRARLAARYEDDGAYPPPAIDLDPEGLGLPNG